MTIVYFSIHGRLTWHLKTYYIIKKLFSTNKKLSYWKIHSNVLVELVNLSLELSMPVVWSGVVPALMEVLRYGHDKARDHVASVIFSQSLENNNKATIIVLGIVPLLLHLFARPSKTIYHLFIIGMNREKVVKGARTVVSVVKEGGEVGLVAMMVVCRLAGCMEGGTTLMNVDVGHC